MDRVIKRNKELEAEVEHLRAQVAASTTPVLPVLDAVPVEMPDEMLMPQKVPLEWVPEPASCAWPGAVPSHLERHSSNGSHSDMDMPVSSGNYVSNPPHPPQVYPTAATAMGYDHEEAEASQQLYAPTAIPVWVHLPEHYNPYHFA